MLLGLLWKWFLFFLDGFSWWIYLTLLWCVMWDANEMIDFKVCLRSSWGKNSFVARLRFVVSGADDCCRNRVENLELKTEAIGNTSANNNIQPPCRGFPLSINKIIGSAVLSTITGWGTRNLHQPWNAKIECLTPIGGQDKKLPTVGIEPTTTRLKA